MSVQEIRHVYKLEYVDGYDWLHPVTSQDFRKLRFDGTSRIASWVPVEMERVPHDEDHVLREPGDFPACSGGDMLLVSAAAKKSLGKILSDAGELLPLRCADGAFWTLNVTQLIDALDEQGSSTLCASDTGQILRIHNHNFFANRLGPEIFKLLQMPRGLIYVTDVFVQRVKATNLKGIDFKLVWAAN